MAIKTFTTGEVLTAADTNTYLANSGLVYVTSVAFTSATAASPVNVFNCFNSSYTNYKVIINTTAATANVEIQLQLVNGTTPATGNDYRFAAVGANSSSASSNNASLTQSFIGLTLTAQNGTIGTSVELFQPQKAIKTNMYGDWFYDDGGVLIFRRFACVHNVASAYDGFRIFTATGSITGTATVYGYRVG